MTRRPALVLAALVVALGLPVLGATPASADIALPGVPIEQPSTDPSEPLPLEAGTWTDTLQGAQGAADSAHQFVYRRTMRASTVFIGVTGANSVENDRVDVVASLPSGEECASDYSESGYENAFGSFGARLYIGPDEPNDGDSACLVADELRFTVSRGTKNVSSPVPVSIRIVEEAPTTSDVTTLPAQPETPRVEVPDVPEGDDLVGADTFEDARYLDDGSYRTTVGEGEQKFWRVRLGWGQQLSTRLRLPAADDATLERIGGFGPNVELVLVDPLLNTFREGVEDAVTSGDYGDEPVTMRDGTSPVAYDNRFGDGVAILPGDYWVTVSVDAPDDRAPIEVPMQLEVQVLGEPGAGAPAFPATVQSPTGDAGPDGYAADTPYLVSPGTFAADVSGSTDAPEPEDDGEASDGSATDDAAADDDTTRRVAGLGAGALGLACCAAGVLLLARRRRG
ncbi:hypothetical protein GCM10023340_41600 [Nocardioides marinquilinus]|uniref:Gram-positive cocci surface proteins LPxTG domain-containing protein n=1 Tax=Nocardioides marinquilinus TaxID=1210400 RepID=A0ABP9Q4A0_9ACTN